MPAGNLQECYYMTALADQNLDASNARSQTGHLISQLASHSMCMDFRRTGARRVNATIPAFAPLVPTSHHSKSIVLAVSHLLLSRWRHVERGYFSVLTSESRIVP